MTEHEWHLVEAQRREPKWHLWRATELRSICAHVDPMVTDLIEVPPRRRFSICQECRCYAQRNNLTMPVGAIIPQRKATT